MSHAIAKIFGEPRCWRSAEMCRQRVAMAAATLSIGFLAFLVVAL